jgi:hypothetical protein
MNKYRKETLMRFHVTATEFETASQYYHCNTKKTWQGFLTEHFAEKFCDRNFHYNKSISNASFRLAGLEIKIGLLLADDEAKIRKKQTLSGAVRPSIVIDSVLSIYSILEGLTMLSYLASLEENTFVEVIKRDRRGKRISDGFSIATNENRDQTIKQLTDLRDRCIHQDCADLKDGLDYEHVFETASLRPHVELLHKYLVALETKNSSLPETNFREFWVLDY